MRGKFSLTDKMRFYLPSQGGPSSHNQEEERAPFLRVAGEEATEHKQEKIRAPARKREREREKSSRKIGSRGKRILLPCSFSLALARDCLPRFVSVFGADGEKPPPPGVRRTGGRSARRTRDDGQAMTGIPAVRSPPVRF